MVASSARRQFLKLSVTAAATLIACPAIVRASTGERTIAMHNLHTGESLRTAYWAEGHYIPEALSEIGHLLRDHRADEATDMDPELMDLLRRLGDASGASEPFHIISGYRSPQTNAKLRKQSGGVAKKSLHVLGKAVDVRLPGVDTRKLYDAARSLKAGGAGYYGKSDFVHVDTGRVRFW